MSILESENDVLKDNSFIIDKIKHWIAYNIENIIVVTNQPNKHTLTLDTLFTSIGSISDQFQSGLSWTNLRNMGRFKHLMKLNDEQFSRYVQVDLTTIPVKIHIKGHVYMNVDAEDIPTDLFVIESVDGNLDMSCCDFKTTDGLPDRENIKGQINWQHCNKLKYNKYL